MTGREAADIIEECYSEQLPLYGKRYSQIARAVVARRWAAEQIAERCARSDESPITIVNDFIHEMEGCLRCYDRTRQEASYERFAQALTAAIDIYEIFTSADEVLSRYERRRSK